MKHSILNGLWEFRATEEDILMNTSFPARIIQYNLSNIDNEQMFKHCMIHELTHAYQAELGQWQNVLENGKSKDEFNSEWIAEFVAIYSEKILTDYNEVKSIYVNR